jgi:hypothetical protein
VSSLRLLFGENTGNNDLVPISRILSAGLASAFSRHSAITLDVLTTAAAEAAATAIQNE